jgi:tetratricopeptide (TPR) repeat protein
MKFVDSKEILKTLIANTRYLDAISDLKVWAEKYVDIYNNLINLHAQHIDIEKRLNLGLIKYKLVLREQTRLRSALLQIIDELEILYRNPNSTNQVVAINHINIGRDKIKYKLFDEALICFNQALKSDPGNIEAIFYKGTSELALDNLEEAIFNFSEVIKLSQGEISLNPFVFLNRGTAYFHLGQKEKAYNDWKEVERLGYPILVQDFINQK